jgi:hypothetical protein
VYATDARIAYAQIRSRDVKAGRVRRHAPAKQKKSALEK